MATKKIKRKKGFFQDNYVQSWNYIKESRNFIYSIIIIFFLFSLIGFFLPVPEYISEQIARFIQDLLQKTQGMSQGELTRFIFFNNVQGSFFGMILGVLLGIFPLISVIANGYLLGFVASLSVQTGGVLILLKLFPHGIFEIPALFISLGLGLKLGSFILRKNRIETFKKYFWDSLRVFIFVVIPLLIIASIIEGGLIFLVR